MSALSWWEFAGCVLAACGLAVAVLAVVLPFVPSGDRGEAEAVQDAPDPVDECLDAIDIPLDGWKPTGWHDDLPLTTTQRLDTFRDLEAAYHHTSVPVIPGQEES